MTQDRKARDLVAQYAQAYKSSSLAPIDDVVSALEFLGEEVCGEEFGKILDVVRFLWNLQLTSRTNVEHKSALAWVLSRSNPGVLEFDIREMVAKQSGNPKPKPKPKPIREGKISDKMRNELLRVFGSLPQYSHAFRFPVKFVTQLQHQRNPFEVARTHWQEKLDSDTDVLRSLLQNRGESAKRKAKSEIKTEIKSDLKIVHPEIAGIADIGVFEKWPAKDVQDPQSWKSTDWMRKTLRKTMGSAASFCVVVFLLVTSFLASLTRNLRKIWGIVKSSATVLITRKRKLNECRVCLNDCEESWACVPCGHCFCRSCTELAQKSSCHYCRAKVDSLVRLFT